MHFEICNRCGGMDLETFLALEKENLQVERERLSARSTGNLHNKSLDSDQQQQIADSEAADCMALRILENKEYASKVKCNRKKDNLFGTELKRAGCDPPPTAVNELPKATTITTNTMSSQRESSIGGGCGVGIPLSKIDKDMANHKELTAVASESGNGPEGANKLNIRNKNKVHNALIWLEEQSMKVNFSYEFEESYIFFMNSIIINVLLIQKQRYMGTRNILPQVYFRGF